VRDAREEPFASASPRSSNDYQSFFVALARRGSPLGADTLPFEKYGDIQAPRARDVPESSAERRASLPYASRTGFIAGKIAL